MVKVGIYFLFLMGLSLNLPSSMAQPGQVYKVASILEAPFMMRKENYLKLQGDDKYEGYCVDLLENIASILGLNYTFDNPLERYGVKDDRAGLGWTGVMGDLTRPGGPAIGIGPLTITSERAAAVDFSPPFMNFRLSFLMKAPSKTSAPEGEEVDNDSDGGQFVFLRPFTFFLWFGFILTIILLVLALYGIERFVYQRKADAQAQALQREQGNPRRMSHQVTAAVTAPPVGFCRQGICGSPKSAAGRFLQIIFWVFLIIFIGAFIANFTADRVADRLDEKGPAALRNSIESIEDLAGQVETKYGVRRGGSTYNYFSKVKVPIYRKMYDMMLQWNSFVNTHQEGVDRALNGSEPFAFIVEAPYADYHVQKSDCNLTKASQSFGPLLGYGLVTRQHHVLSPQIAQEVLRLREAGNLDLLYRKWFQKFEKTQCPGSERFGGSDGSEAHDPLTLEDLAGLFYILGGVVILALIIAGVEVTVGSKNKGAKSGPRNDRAVEVPLRET